MNEQANKNMLWEKDSKWLQDSRKDMWNQDYLEFLVKHVWKVDKPVNIIDFGCGIGYLGSVLLPLLPKGSAYTGLDIANHLLEDARSIFANTEWTAEFHEQDLTQYLPVEKYDIAICQTLLVHIPSPEKILEKMVRSVVTGGRVICIEPNWALTHMGVYRHGMDKYMYSDMGLYQKMFDIKLKRDSIDRYIGIKIPAMLQDLGMKNIDIRICDKANFTFNKPKKLQSEAMTEKKKGWYYDTETYVEAGLDVSEAERHVESLISTADFENNHDRPTVSVMAWLVSYGEK